LDPVTEHLSIIHAFGGAAFIPSTSLIAGADGNLYGCTREFSDSSSGTLFRINPLTSSFTILHHFAWPEKENPIMKFHFRQMVKFMGLQLMAELMSKEFFIHLVPWIVPLPSYILSILPTVMVLTPSAN
jgi:hypothetical protein